MKRVVTVLQTDGWANTPRAVALVKEYAKKIKLDISVEQIVSKNQEDVQSYKFIGSPTIRINGLDVDPTARSVTQYGITWRLIDWMQDASSIEKVLHAAFVEAGWINA